jgi:hypothetical protein
MAPATGSFGSKMSLASGGALSQAPSGVRQSEVDALTDLLVQSMNCSSDPDFFGASSKFSPLMQMRDFKPRFADSSAVVFVRKWTCAMMPSSSFGTEMELKMN